MISQPESKEVHTITLTNSQVSKKEITLVERARPVHPEEIAYGGLRRSGAVVRGAIPPGRVRGIPVGVNDPGYVEPPQPTRIDTLTPQRIVSGAIPASPGFMSSYSPERSATVISPTRNFNAGPVHHPHPVAHSPSREYIPSLPGNPMEPVTTIYPGKEFVTRGFSPARRTRMSRYSPARGSFTSQSGPFGTVATESYQPGYESHFEAVDPPVERVTRHFTPPRAVTTMPPRYVGSSDVIRSPNLPREIAMGRTYYDGASTTYGDPGKLRIERQPGF